MPGTQPKRGVFLAGGGVFWEVGLFLLLWKLSKQHSQATHCVLQFN